MPQNDIKIRKYQKNDLIQVKEICDKSFQKTDEVFLIVESMVNIEHFYVAENRSTKQIIGFVIFGIFSIRVTHLLVLGVHPKYQRKGIGSLLLERVIETTKLTPITSIRLEVRTTNKGAIEFYKRYGFKIATTIENYYSGKNSDAYLMIKKMDDE